MDMVLHAAQLCGMAPFSQSPTWPLSKPTEPANAPTVIPAGEWYEYQYASSDGLVVDCYLEYEAEEAPTRDCPGDSESINLVYALVNGVDISGVLCESVEELIEEEALQSMAMDKWNGDYDKGEERWHDREAA